MSFHLPSLKATPLIFLLACCLGVAWAGAIHRKHHNRPDGVSGSPHPSTSSNAGRKTTMDGAGAPLKQTAGGSTRRPEFVIANSQQRSLFKNGKKVTEVPVDSTSQVQDNGTVAQPRVVKRTASSSSTYCEIEEQVTYVHEGECVVIGGMDFCQTEYLLELGNSHCT